jgi:hypothetical protein
MPENGSFFTCSFANCCYLVWCIDYVNSRQLLIIVRLFLAFMIALTIWVLDVKGSMACQSSMKRRKAVAGDFLITMQDAANNQDRSI